MPPDWTTGMCSIFKACPWIVPGSFNWCKLQQPGQFSLPPEQHITPLLHKLHWLPICFWVQFKGLILTFKALHGMGSSNLRDCLAPNTQPILLVPSESMLWVPSAWDLKLMAPRRPHQTCHSAHLMEHSVPPTPLSCISSIHANIQEDPQDLDVSSGLGVPGK